ncbi:hypothetical protein JYK14_23515 [Siccirubricoccus sp. KC 17139]|uniref:Uncharacterized protein n=1 Tax=Siccirubricoccus soli TaxID=2899147 RepID=A0ABT1DAY7_9PROT|nr:hypothetical protein [Siccirubricoccus soli]MCO6419105.1 hypothetical protein [Siccirubricoccus soli]MCP2685240.1 hypothetical protein [Siccirubricoccus soli]
MAALASLATVLGAGASIYGTVRQAQSQQATAKAQAQLTQQQQAARQQELAAQQAEQARERQQALARTLAATRARLAASGLQPDEGSAAAVTGGLRQDAAAAQAADDAAYQARLAQGRASLLQPDGTLTALLRSGRTFGFAARSLLD